MGPLSLCTFTSPPGPPPIVQRPHRPVQPPALQSLRRPRLQKAAYRPEVPPKGGSLQPPGRKIFFPPPTYRHLSWRPATPFVPILHLGRRNTEFEICREPGAPTLRIKTRERVPLTALVALAGLLGDIHTPKRATLVPLWPRTHNDQTSSTHVNFVHKFASEEGPWQSADELPQCQRKSPKPTSGPDGTQDIFSSMLEGTRKEFTKESELGRLDYIQGELKLV